MTAYFVRFLWCGFGLCAVIWGTCVLPVIWRQATIIAAGKRVIAGDNFKRNALDQVASKASETSGSKWQRPSILASAAIIDLRLLEQAVGDGRRIRIDRQQEVLKSTIQKALSNEPADSFLWLTLFWLENARNGFRPESLKYLSMSYTLGPNEGWISVKRNRLALALFPELTPKLKARAILEFAHLVDSGFVPEAADILTGPGWSVRDRLLASLADVNDVYREDFAKTVYHLGYDLSVPGVKPFGFRPWQ